MSDSNIKRGRRTSLAVLAWLMVLTVGVFGAIYLDSKPHDVEMWTADVDLPAFHQIKEGDLDLQPVDSELTNSQVYSKDQRESLIGAYTVTSVEQGRPFKRSDVGPRLPPDSVTGFALSLDYSSRTTLAGRMARGDLADLYILGNGKPRMIPDVLILDIVSKGMPAVVIEVSRSDVPFAVQAVDERVVLVRTTPYSAP